MADRPQPYVKKDPGDIMLAADWNEIQVRAREDVAAVGASLAAHDHSDRPLARAAIAPNAIDGSRVDPAAALKVTGLESKTLKITGKSQLGDLDAAAARFAGSKFAALGDASVAGNLALGGDTPENAENWNRVLDVLGTDHAKLSVRGGGVDARVMAHGSGIYNAPAGMAVGTRSNHPLSFTVAGATRATLQLVDSRPVLDLFMDTNPIRLSTRWSGFPDPRTNGAEIANDTETYKTLMIIGNKSAGDVRRVAVWDRLDVNGTLFVSAALTANGGMVFENPVGAHLNRDGALYRFSDGQCYLTVDDNLYIRDSTGPVHMHFDTKNGILRASKLRLGDKWLLSGVGDAEANDDWLRLKNAGSPRDYYGGFAASKLWSTAGQIGSDARMKQDIAPIAAALSKLRALRGVQFNWKPEYGQGRQAGMVAQEVQAVLPEAVAPGPNGLLGISYSGVVALLVQAVNEQQALLEQLLAAPGNPAADGSQHG
ncbi:MAG: tail fiber domain-containing protein [Rhodocyclaceae bacterium]|nr:tail fiber domain-containing protein [Rhodocyclaceae bacterium]